MLLVVGWCLCRYGLQCSGGWVTRITLRKNGLGGVLKDIGGALSSGLPYLERLDLSQNMIIGTMPPELGEMQSLTHLILSYNHFSGSIPSLGVNSTSLVHLILGNNQLTGGIPDGFRYLTGLSELDLSYNRLTGPVPDWLGNLALISLWINNNNLSGQLPLSLCRSLILCSGAFNPHLMCASMSCTCGAMQSCNCNNMCQTNGDCAGGLCTTCVGASKYYNGYCK